MVRRTTSSSSKKRKSGKAAEDFCCGVIPVLKKDGEEPLFLLVRHQAGHWAFPKGHPHPGERPEDTARREFEEETGIKGCILFLHETFSESYVIRGTRGPGVRKTVTYFLGFVRQRRVRLQAEEICDSRWLKFDDALQRITFEECRRLLRRAHDFMRRKL